MIHKTVYAFIVTFMVLMRFFTSPEKAEAQNLLKDSTSFTFVFISDVHIQPELHATEKFITAIDSINKYHPDFVITGGDLVSDALAQTKSRADSLFNLYVTTIRKIHEPVYNTIGNHDIFGWYPRSGVSPKDSLFGKKMFETKIGPRYQSFFHKGWKFMILDDIDLSEPGIYQGGIDSIQINWIKSELTHTSRNTPIALVMHIPLITTFSQMKGGSMAPNTKGLVVSNSKQVLELFNGYNLKMVLQGHLHILEDDFTYGIHFITGGSIAGEWWKGPHEGTKEGILLIHVNPEKFSYDYIPYQWNPNN